MRTDEKVKKDVRVEKPMLYKDYIKKSSYRQEYKEYILRNFANPQKKK